jgi:hypothetical protein
MAKFHRTVVLGLAACVLGSSLVLAQTTPPSPDTGRPPATTQAPKKGKRAQKKKAPPRKKRVKKPSTGTQQPG